MNFYKILSIATSALFAYLFISFFLNSDSFITDIGLQASQTTSILAKRASLFMLGISILQLNSMNLHHSKARQSICLATGITMLGLGCMGSYELARGTVNSSILVSIIIETTLGISFISVLILNRKNRKVQLT